MKGLIELAVLAIGVPYLFRLVSGRRTYRIRLVQRRAPSTFVLIVCLAVGLVALAATGT